MTVIMGFISQQFVRQRYPKAFSKYNYILSGALVGTQYTQSHLSGDGRDFVTLLYWTNLDATLL